MTPQEIAKSIADECNMSPQIKLTARCTTCKRTHEMSAQQISEARDVGCAFSPCCQSVATIERVDLRLQGPRTSLAKSRREAKQRAADARYLQAGWQLPEV